MNFTDALEEMKQGKKLVRRAWGNKDEFWTQHKLVNEDMNLSWNNITAVDWVIREEEKLSDKIQGFMCHGKDNDIKVMGNPTQEMIDKHSRQGFCYEEDIKKALKEFLDWLPIKIPVESETYSHINPRIKAEKVFGEGLL